MNFENRYAFGGLRQRADGRKSVESEETAHNPRGGILAGAAGANNGWVYVDLAKARVSGDIVGRSG